MEKYLLFALDHWILSSLFVGLAVALLLTERLRGGKSLSPQQVVRLMNNDEAVIVDVREKKDLAEGVIKGSIHMPVTSLKERAGELKKHEGKTIVIADKMGQHSGMAVRALAAAGVTGVQRLSGGIVEWRNANLPLSKK
ncbi:rhodanese-like domain-containing protein [Hahella aquimaris]|uniref:rhodanese-like domain-containing protein n=1 Tax=Hahella sp. HNIBRBA332 TaxID=3015983 RepID=UPI00273C0735|nr:rhodanese-like domain-containing protein [Hahella sp. HNIBRBA332]WLQ11891.1 rhodanese-like domain-containing protein [Hahella sp. HNIBRBA332]